jgi:hypothetical protein
MRCEVLIVVVMLTKGNSGAVNGMNGLVTSICRPRPLHVAGNMKQHGAEVEILQKQLPQIL